jgi:predicted nucleic acid-binding protein
MIAVLDASAGIEIALGREKAKIFNSHMIEATKIISSDLYKAETSNVIWKYVKANLLTKENAMQTYKYCESIVEEFIDISENAEEAINESIRLNHSTYDLLYFILARRNGGVLITLDKKLGDLAEKNGIEIAR